MQAAPTRHLPIAGTYNVRDLGGYPIADGQTQWRRMLRADTLHRLDEAGIAEMLESGVTTVIDLRHGHELTHQPNPFDGHSEVAFHNVSLLEGLSPSLLGEGDVLLALYKMALLQRQSAVAEVMQIIAYAPPGAVLFHCTAGKDRTGIVAALLLGVAGVEAGLIVEDYALTAGYLAPIMAEITAEAVTRGAEPVGFQRLLASEPQTMAATLAFIDAEFGSVAAYLDRIGLAPATIDRLRNRLVGEI